MRKKHASSPWQQSNSCNQIYKMLIVYTFTCLSVSNGFIYCVEFNDTSTLVGHFVSSPREREKRDRRDRRRDEREGQGRGTGMKVKKQKK